MGTEEQSRTRVRLKPSSGEDLTLKSRKTSAVEEKQSKTRVFFFEEFFSVDSEDGVKSTSIEGEEELLFIKMIG